MLTVLIVLFVAKSIVIDLLVLFFIKDHIELNHYHNRLVEQVRKDVALINSDASIFDARLNTLESEVGIEYTVDD